MIKKIFLFFVYLFSLVGFILVVGYGAVKMGITNQKGIIDEQKSTFVDTPVSEPGAWSQGEEWMVLSEAIRKDESVIVSAAEKSGVSSRKIVALLVPEQLRLFHDNRELFKAVFAPLRILGNQNQFSLGVMGIKPETAEQIEDHLKDLSSDFYLGKENESLLDFKTENPGQERLERLTDEGNRYYSYLYAGLALKQLETQWQRAGFPISENIAVLATLYNIGFAHSKPHASPQSGGAVIEIGGERYGYGQLAQLFYNSKELDEEFPR